MIDFNLCRKCALGEYQAAVCENGETKVKASVKCNAGDDETLLFMNSDPPKECPFALEHKLTTQAVPLSFANFMSGYRRRKREAKI